MGSQGRFITFEGGEGSGKSTQIQLLAEALKSRNIHHLVTREPGGTTLAEAIRSMILSIAGEAPMDPVTETLLFAAARQHHVAEVIRPALEAGKVVLCDRFYDSTRVYQGMVKGLGQQWIDMLHAHTLGNLKPDMTFLLDIDADAGLQRARGRGENQTKYEAESVDFHRRIREGFLALAKAEPERFTAIDASRSEKAVADDIWKQIGTLIP